MKKPSSVVDLHADSFLENWKDYSPEELAGEAILYMREKLDAAIYWEMPQIQFIHGKGKGVLKKLVYQELQEYKDSRAISHFYPSYKNEDIVVVIIGI